MRPLSQADRLGFCFKKQQEGDRSCRAASLDPERVPGLDSEDVLIAKNIITSTPYDCRERYRNKVSI